MQTAAQFISHYRLLPHPEGGYFREVYRSGEYIPAASLPARFGADRNFATGIYFLLEQANFSAFHRIKSDECWHFYAGQRLIIYIIHPAGDLETVYLGSEFNRAEKFQFVVPAGCWFASEAAPGSSFGFVGCTVAPGFDFADFELAKREQLVQQYPAYEMLIRRLTR